MYQKMLSRQEIHILLPELLAKAKKDQPFSLLLIKPADFRLLQMELTPIACDEVLKIIADIIQKNMPKTAKAGHWAGITFALLLPSYGKNEAENLALEISHLLNKTTLPNNLSGRKLSLIFAAAEAPPRSISQIGLQAERSLAKEEGRFLPLPEKSFSHEDFLKNFLHGFLQANDSYLSEQSLLASRLVNKYAAALGLKPKEREGLALSASYCRYRYASG